MNRSAIYLNTIPVELSYLLEANRFCMKNTTCCFIIVQFSCHDIQKYISFTHGIEQIVESL